MKIIKIDSKYRQDGTSSKFTYILPTTMCISKLKLLKSLIPNTSYVVNGGNNKISFTNGGVTCQVSLTVGNYNPNSLAQHLAQVLGTGFTVTVDPISLKFTITFTSSITIHFSQYPYFSLLFGYLPVNKTASSFVADNVYRVMNTPYYNIMITNLSTLNIFSNTKSLFTILNDGVFGDIITNQHFDDEITLCNPDALLGQLDIEIRDSEMNLVEFNGHNVVFEFIIE